MLRCCAERSSDRFHSFTEILDRLGEISATFQRDETGLHQEINYRLRFLSLLSEDAAKQRNNICVGYVDSAPP
jgi:hypothetical protein